MTAGSAVAAHFSQTYAEARAKFLVAAEAAKLDAFAQVHPMLGREDETLALDVVIDGPRSARSLLIVSSACHGVEGFCGSAVQTMLLHSAAFRQAAAQAKVAVLYLHALNPYGFSWWRRTTQENVDLNRNFHDFSKPLPRNPAYDEIAAALIPATWPPPAQANAAIQHFLETRGLAEMQRAVSGGQYDHPQGIFYGGRNPTWSHIALRHALRDHASRCERLGWIDLHTGLGPSGVGERIFACQDDAAALQRARSWWGSTVTSLYDGSSSSAPLEGQMWQAAYEECAQAEYTGIALEFGTVPLLQTLNALRADQWAENHPEAAADLAAQISRQTRDAFYIDTDDWKARVVDQALDAALGAVRGLSLP